MRRFLTSLIATAALLGVGAVPASAISTSQVLSNAAAYNHSQCIRYTGCSNERRISYYLWESGYIGVDLNWQVTSAFDTRYYGRVCTIYNYHDLAARPDQSDAYYWDC